MKNINNLLIHLFSDAVEIDKIFSNGNDKSTDYISNPCLFKKRELEDISSKKQYLLDSALDVDSKKNIYDLILDKAKYFLNFDDGDPICNYESLLEWRELSFHLGQDIFTCSYNGCKSNLNTDFSWSPIAKNDNKRLNLLLKNGIAENHFHLKGSTQIFPLNWINIMNNPFSRNREIFDLKTTDEYDVDFSRSDYKHKLEKVEIIADEFISAANIRLYLFLKYCTDDYPEDFRNLEENKSDDKSENSKKGKINIISNDGNVDIFKMGEFSSKLSVMREKYGIKISDYIFDYAITDDLVKNENNLILTGERNILSYVFKSIYKRSNEDKKSNRDDDSNRYNDYEKEEAIAKAIDKSTKDDMLLFYKYLLIKNKCRKIFIQRNGIDGFDNFANYEHRKEIFIYGNPHYEEQLNKMAINTTLSNQNIKSLEARLGPKKNSFDLATIINTYIETRNKYFRDKIAKNPNEIKTGSLRDIMFGDSNENNIESRDETDLFFVLHFPKFTEKRCESNENPVNFRNMKTRQGLSSTMMPIAAFFKNSRNFKNSKFVKGIDTCNQEMSCRPDVFGYAYRFLLSDDIVDGYEKSVNLMATYHVGEDFFSLSDGLRAIHEILTFLGYKRGCRLGHSLVLGIDPEKYYRKHEFKLIMPQQNLLDNFVWLLNVTEEADIEISHPLRRMLETKANNLLEVIYKYTIKKIDKNHSNMLTEKTNKNSSQYDNYFYGMNNYGNSPLTDYYHSMYLRSDYYRLFRLNYSEYKNSSNNSLLIEEKYFLYDKDNENRHRNANSFEFCKDYIVNEEIRYLGDKYEEFEIETEYRQEVISIVKSLQKYFSEKLISKGISIETNPSSNVLIGPIERYIEHPIFRFNCRCLKDKSSDLPSLSVSINTDDQGVFDTYIENEYALIALALEKEMKESKSYEVEDIYEYLDYIRKQGFEQAFK